MSRLFRVFAFPNPSGSRYWRLQDPFKYLSGIPMGDQILDAQIWEKGINDDVLSHGDLFVTQGTVDKEGIGSLYAYQQELGKKIVVEADDFPEVLEDNPYKMSHDATDAPALMKKTMEIADAITCTTNYLAGKLRTINPNVFVLPNYMAMERWDLPKYKNDTDTIRIGWAGSITHLKDIEMVVPALEKILLEYPQVQLVFVGDLRIRDLFNSIERVEVLPGVPFDVWPSKLHSLRLDIGLAPLVDNEFNRCKSNIKWLEYSIAQVPGVFSPTVYQHKGFQPKYGLIAYEPDDWYKTIKVLIDNPEMRKDIGINAYRLVKNKFSLKTHVHKWMETYMSISL